MIGEQLTTTIIISKTATQSRQYTICFDTASYLPSHITWDPPETTSFSSVQLQHMQRGNATECMST